MKFRLAYCLSAGLAIWALPAGAIADSICLSNHPRPPEDVIQICTDELAHDQDIWVNSTGGSQPIGNYYVTESYPASALFLTRGNAYMALGQYDNAISDFTNAFQMNPKQIAILINRATAYSAEKNYDLALDDLNRILTSDALTDSLRAVALIDRVALYNKKKEFDLALSDANEAVKYGGDEPRAYTSRASVYYFKGDLDSAYADLQHALQLDHSDMRAHYWIAIIRLSRSDFAEAIQEFNTAAGLGVKPDPYILTARCYALAMEKQSLDSAMGDCNAAVASSGNYAIAFNARGFLNFQLGHYQDALNDYSAALARNPPLASAYYGRAMAEQKLGNETAAQSDLAAAKALDPDADKHFGTAENLVVMQ